MKYIIKISPEITIKSKPVRKQCIKLLTKNIKIHLNKFDGFFEIKFFWDKIETIFKIPNIDEEIQEILGKIPGISHFVKVDEYLLFDDLNRKENAIKNIKKDAINHTSTDIKDINLNNDKKQADIIKENNKIIFDNILEKILPYYIDKISNKTFVVRVNRGGEHDFTSVDVERYIGGGLLQKSNNTKVKLKNPEITVKIEIKDNKFYIIKDEQRGLGGYPVGFQDKVLSLISGGFDSGVSTYSMMKRGCIVDYLFFNLGGGAHELGVKQVAHHLWKNFSPSHKKSRFITVNFEKIIKELLTKINHKYRGIILKRFMLKIASMISEKHYYAVIKGDSLGQVSSQTLKNMNIIDKSSSILVLRPLISNNKQDIIDISKKIGTYNFACDMPEYCGIISDKPATGAKLEKVLEEEKNIQESVLTEAFENKKIEFVSDFLKNCDDFLLKKDIDIVFESGKDDIVIDLREEIEKKKFPLKLKKEIKILEIPFFEINHKFKNLDQTKNYLFYCSKGVLSNLHGLYLKEKGFDNIKMFRDYKKIN